MDRGVIDGVTILWREVPGPLRAELSFGCGHRDEEIDTIGLNHFVQLLASPTEDHAGIASHLTTSFTVSGPPDQIVSELAGICSALTAVPDPDRMAEVARQAEPGDRFSGLDIDSDLRYPFAALLSRRFGPHGLGLVRWPTVDYSLFTAAQVKAHTRRYFVAANAVLTLTGQPPEGLRLPLPQAAKPVREALPVGSAPLWFQDEVDRAGALPWKVSRSHLVPQAVPPRWVRSSNPRCSSACAERAGRLWSTPRECPLWSNSARITPGSATSWWSATNVRYG